MIAFITKAAPIARRAIAAVAAATVLLGASAGKERQQSSTPDEIGTPAGRLAVLCRYTAQACPPRRLPIDSVAVGTHYVRQFGSHSLSVPWGFVDDLEILAKPTLRDPSPDLRLMALLPGFAPRDNSNLPYFFMPLDGRRISIEVSLRMPGALDWPLAAKADFERTRASVRRELVRRPDRYGLEIWGENFDRWPGERPCASLSGAGPSCRTPAADDAMRPLNHQANASVISCTPDVVEDDYAPLTGLTAVQQDEYFASDHWVGRRRPVCRHEMFYPAWNARVTLRYPRRFLADWVQTEARARELLDSLVR